MSNTVEMLKRYKTASDQELKDLEFIIKAEEIFGDILTRENEFCHLTASSFVLNRDHTKVLCIYHNIYKSWGWMGGHADGEDDMLFVARKETREESSFEKFDLLGAGPISIEVLPVRGHVKNGKYISGHLHLNITYLFEADETDLIHISEGENSDVAWLEFDELLEKCSEDFMKPVYKKIIERVRCY